MSESFRISEKKSDAEREGRKSRARKSNYSQPVNSVNRILFLQRTIGNQAVIRLIKSGALQAKFKIGQPEDEYEQEADRVAGQVMRMPEPTVSEKKDCDGESISIQRKCPKLEQYEKMQSKPLENIPQAQGKETPEVAPELEEDINYMSGRGHPLPDQVRSFLEPRFGYDFNLVRIHADHRADRLTRSVNALAFTTGHDIYFRSGAYNSTSRDGLHLLAHELTHTVQQTGDVKAKQFSRQPDIQMKCSVCNSEELQRFLDISSAPKLIQRERWDLVGPDAASCKEKIAEDTAECADETNIYCSTVGGAVGGGLGYLGAKGGEILGGYVGGTPGIVGGGAVGSAVGGGIGGLTYGECYKIWNKKCRENGRQKARECDQQFSQQQPQPPTNVETTPVQPDENYTPYEPTEPEQNYTPYEPTEPEQNYTPYEPTEPEQNYTPYEPTEPEQNYTPYEPTEPEQNYTPADQTPADQYYTPDEERE